MKWTGFFALLTGLALTACATKPEVPVILEGAAWSLLELNGRPVTEISTSPRHPSLRFDPAAGRIGGYAGVNSYGGGYQLEGGTLAIGSLMVTKMAGTPEHMRLEEEFLGALAQVTGWRIENDLLELTSPDGRVLARFTRRVDEA